MIPLHAVASQPWIFTQSTPLDTRSFRSEAKRRGFDLNVVLLRELYRRRLLVPLAAIRDRRVSAPVLSTHDPQRPGGTRLEQFRRARSTGRLQDLTAAPFKDRLRFTPPTRPAPPGWWNGLLYSRHQLLILPHLRATLDRARWVSGGDHRAIRLPTPSAALMEQAQRYHDIALVVTAVEARYLPNLDPEWARLRNTDYEEWAAYREKFDPVLVAETLGYQPSRARRDAEHLLSLAHTIDPFGREWGPLVRRAPRRSWEGLTGDARISIDLREAAEILLRFYEDLASHDRAEPLPQPSGRVWHPLHERLSIRARTLDEDLARLGISPHPRVVLAIEGDSEAVHVPKVWAALGFRDAPELLRVLVLGSADRDLEKIAALAAAPLISRHSPSDMSYDLLRPPTKLFVAVDPEGRYFGSPTKIEKTHGQIISEIRKVVEAQGARVDEDELHELLEIRTWNEACYELAHFTNEELADAILQVNRTSGQTRTQLIQSIAETRARQKDIKEVWGRWPRHVSKVDLAHALWPALERQIAEANSNKKSRFPEIAQVLASAYATAQNWQFGSFTLTSSASSDLSGLDRATDINAMPPP